MATTKDRAKYSRTESVSSYRTRSPGNMMMVAGDEQEDAEDVINDCDSIQLEQLKELVSLIVENIA